jgi:hypothetical protein
MAKRNGPAAIKSGFSRDNNAVYQAICRLILLSLQGNENFTDPTPTLETYSVAIESFSNWCSVAKDGTKNDKRARDDSRAALNQLTKKLAQYVTSKADGDAIKLGTSGFPFVKSWEPTPPITVPENLKLANAGSGNIDVSVDTVANAKIYLFQYTADPLTSTSIWTNISFSKKKYTVTGLTPGTIYWFRVAAVGVRGQITYSMVASIMCS